LKNSIQIRNLGSSSSGNSTLIWTETDSILVDMGFSQRYMAERFEEADVLFSSLRGVLITHLHNDHVNQAFLNKLIRNQIPVYLHEQMTPVFLQRYKVKSDTFIQTFGASSFDAAGFTVQGFEVPHDSPGGCFGFNLHRQAKKITIATDMGFPKNGLAEKFVDSDVIIVESNHDVQMLESSHRSYQLIDRIKQIGHLSNEQCVQFLDDILKKSDKLPKAVLLAHLSAECNLSSLAQDGVQFLLDQWKYGETRLQVLKKNAASETLRI